MALNQWVGYYPSLQSAWGALTAGPLPNEVQASDQPSLRNTEPATGKLVKVDISDAASGFTHRSEYVYLPPAWFAGDTPPALPVVMMIGGEFNTPADWIRSGNFMPTVESYDAAHGGQLPIFVFVDTGGSFRGKKIDNLTLTIADGKVTAMEGSGPGYADLKAMYDASDDARKAEFSFFNLGINPVVKLGQGSTGSWVPAGAVTVGTGGNAWAGGDNHSGLGQTVFLPGSTVTLDDRPIVENGELKL